MLYGKSISVVVPTLNEEKNIGAFLESMPGYVDEIILPSETRSKLIAIFSMLENKADKIPRKKHGNIPL